MFGIKHNECVGFESRWKVKKVHTESTTQTTEFSSTSTGTNTLMTNSVEVQTEESTTRLVDTDMQKLAKWLSEIYPKVKEQIDDVNNSQAFKGYQQLGDNTEANCELLQSFNIVKSLENHSGGDRLTKISSISWNQTGKSIAVSRNFDHNSWCYHTGCAVVYTLDRDDFLPNVPKKKLISDSCITSLKFHPKHPAILAAGTYSGGLTIWNIQHDDLENVVVTKNIHDEKVTQISWIRDLDNTIMLATSSTDGLLKLWNFTMNSSLSLKARYRIKPPLLGTIAGSTISETLLDNISQGVICFDFSKHFPEKFVVGLEGGLIVQCSLLGATELRGSTKEEPLLDPAFKYYEPHKGEIITVCFSPNRCEMFMTCGTDAEIRIYLIDQEDPAQIIFTKIPLADVVFIPYEERLVAGCGSNGIIEIFHLQKGKAIENISKETIKKSILTCMMINEKKTNIVAVGNVNGDVQLWSVPWILFSMK